MVDCTGWTEEEIQTFIKVTENRKESEEDEDV
jgi:hypothetical protein